MMFSLVCTGLLLYSIKDSYIDLTSNSIVSRQYSKYGTIIDKKNCCMQSLTLISTSVTCKKKKKKKKNFKG